MIQTRPFSRPLPLSVQHGAVLITDKPKSQRGLCLLIYVIFIPRDINIQKTTSESRRWRFRTPRLESAKVQSQVGLVNPEALPALLIRDVLRHRVMYPVGNRKLYLYTSFLDDRVTPNIIRIFGVQHRDINITDFRCRVLPSANRSESRVTWLSGTKWEFIDKTWPMWSPYFAIHIECPVVIEGTSTPTQVLLSCGADRNDTVTLPVEVAIQVQHQRSLAIIVKPITGQFYVARLVEWIELQRLIGIDSLILYNTDICGASRYVLDYYQNVGLVHTVTFPYLTSVLEKVEQEEEISPQDRYAVYQQVYLVALQGALYRFRKAFKYLAVIDLDEVILPTRQEALHVVIERLARDHQDGAGFTFSTAWHFEDAKSVTNLDVPPYLYMQLFAKASKPNQIQPKSVLVTSRTRTLNFHVVMTSLNSGDVTEVKVDWRNYGYVHHYRGRCESKFVPETCQSIVKNSSLDTVMTRYLSDIRGRVYSVLDHLQLRRGIIGRVGQYQAEQCQIRRQRTNRCEKPSGTDVYIDEHPRLLDRIQSGDSADGMTLTRGGWRVDDVQRWSAASRVSDQKIFFTSSANVVMRMRERTAGVISVGPEYDYDRTSGNYPERFVRQINGTCTRMRSMRVTWVSGRGGSVQRWRYISAPRCPASLSTSGPDEG
ncbi:hypothetical protein LSH36_143g01025 [Paralvinella palmiformis]|uniref:Glycosyltransferase family 92 protein n=1 Tax=Paralvinella palmiformis TaxID=53620 RepID=A0AAD9JVG5_9ANNE|nr:hypothetical protein LSH36_143g01025 [Paralvinella palmiformis]